MALTPGRPEIEGLAERIEAFAAGLDDSERDLFGYLLNAAHETGATAPAQAKAEGYSSPLAGLLASVLKRTTVTPGFSIRFFPWIRHKSPVFDDHMVVKPSN